MDYRLTRHAALELERRRIPGELVQEVLENPEQVVKQRRSALKVLQSRCDFGEGKIYLLRVVIDDSTEPGVIVTVYRTSKIDKYWDKP